MAKDNFDLKAFLVENKMTVTSRGNKIRKHFLAEGLDERKKVATAVSVIPVMEESDDVDVDVEDGDFIPPEDLPMGECGDMEGTVLEGTIDGKIQAAFDRLGIDRESFNKFAQQALGKFHGNVPKMFNLVKKAYGLSDRQVRFMVDKQLQNWTRSGFGATGRDLGRKGSHGMTYSDTDSYTGDAITEDFADIANAAAREQDRYEDSEEDDIAPAADIFGKLGSTSYEAPEDFGDVDEKSIRRSYQSLKNQGIADEKAMKILSKTYDVPEDTVRAIFRTELGNKRQKAVQVDEPKEKVSSFRLPKRGSAAEKAAMADLAGEFEDSEDSDEFAKPGETDDDEEDVAMANGGEGAKGTLTYHYKDKKGEEGDLTFVVPENITMYETEPELIKRLQSYPLPQNANPFLRRALGTLNKDAAVKGSGKMYLYLTAKGFYATSPVNLRVGDPIQLVQGGKPIDTKVSLVVAEMDCSNAQAKVTRRQAADAAKTGAQTGTATSGYGSMELSNDEIESYVHSKAWNAKSIEQKLRDEYFPWSDEASEYMEDDEIADAKADIKNETPVDPESDWAKMFAARK